MTLPSFYCEQWEMTGEFDVLIQLRSGDLFVEMIVSTDIKLR